jgi:hypothetical protein
MAMMFHPKAALDHTETTIVYKGESRAIAELPLQVLVFIFLRWHSLPARSALAVAKEIRLRCAGATISNYLLHKLNSIDPPPCACGGPGIYIVGTTTYCRHCRVEAVRQRVAYTMYTEQLKTAAELEFRPMMAARKDRDRLRALHTTANRNRRR